MPVLKSPGKPNLFSYDLERELQFLEPLKRANAIPKQMKKYQYQKQMAEDFLNVIEIKTLTERQLDNFANIIIDGDRHSWDISVNKLSLLAYHFDEAKRQGVKLIRHKNAKVVVRALCLLSDAFSDEELAELLEEALRHRSKVVRTKACSIALELRKVTFYKILKQRLSLENDADVVASLNFAIDNLHKPDDGLTFKF